jgi:hypothetical protein
MCKKAGMKKQHLRVILFENSFLMSTRKTAGLLLLAQLVLLKSSDVVRVHPHLAANDAFVLAERRR